MSKIGRFFDDYINPRRIIESKKEYRRQMARVDALPSEYQCVFKQIQGNVWYFAAGTGYDMIDVQYGLIDLFEEGAAQKKQVLEITGEDVAAFVEGLLENTRTYISDWRNRLNNKVRKSVAASEEAASSSES